MYLQHAKTKSLEAEEKLKELKGKIKRWMDVNGIPGDIARNIKQQINNDKLVEKNKNDIVDLLYMFSILLYPGKKLLRRHFCMDILKNELQIMEEKELETISDYLQPQIFPANGKVVEEGTVFTRFSLLYQALCRRT